MPDDHRRLFRPHLDGLRQLVEALDTDVASFGDPTPDGTVSLVFLVTGLAPPDADAFFEAFHEIPNRIDRPLDDCTDEALGEGG